MSTGNAAAPYCNGNLQIEFLSLNLPIAEIAMLEEHLSSGELDAARRFRFNRDRKRYVAGRGLLRALLAARLGVTARAVEFKYGTFGKPTLSDRFSGVDISFNISHSEDHALVAIGHGLEVGVDLERVRPLPDLDSLSEHSFSPAEREALRELPASSRLEAFFRCWTRKEAYMKGRGDGFALAPDSFEVSVAPDEPARLIRVSDKPADAGLWRIGDVTVPRGWAAALAMRDCRGEM